MQAPTKNTDLPESPDRLSFEKLVAVHYQAVYLVAYAQLANRELAEDATQEAFLRAYLSLDHLKDYTRFAPWICRIVRHVAIDWLRSPANTRHRSIAEDLQTEVSLVPDTRTINSRDAAANVEARLQLRDAIQRLSPDLREVLLLHYVEGLSHREIGKWLEIHPTTVGYRLGLARSKSQSLFKSAIALTNLERPSGAAVSRATALIAATSLLSITSKQAIAAKACALTPVLSTSTQVSSVTSAGTKVLAFVGYLVGSFMKAKPVSVAAATAIAVVGGGLLYKHQEAKTQIASGTVSASASQGRQPGTDKVLAGVRKRFLVHRNGHVVCRRTITSAQAVRIGKLIDSNYDLSGLTFQPVTAEYQDFYFVQAGKATRIRYDATIEGVNQTGQPSPYTYLRDEVNGLEIVGAKDKTGHWSARRTDPKGGYSVPGPMEVPLRFVHEAVFSPLIKDFGCDGQAAEVHRIGHLVEYTMRCQGETVTTMTVDLGTMNVHEYQVAYPREGDGKLVLLERLTVSEFQQIENQSYPFKLMGIYLQAPSDHKLETANSISARDNRHDDIVRDVIKVVWEIAALEFDRPQFQANVSLDDLDGAHVIDARQAFTNAPSYTMVKGMSEEDIQAQLSKKQRGQGQPKGFQLVGFPSWLLLASASFTLIVGIILWLKRARQR